MTLQKDKLCGATIKVMTKGVEKLEEILETTKFEFQT